MNFKFTSNIDNTGRFVIPKKILKELGWDGITAVDVTIDGDSIRITKGITVPACENCGKELTSKFAYCPYCGKEV